ncbi:hypothetical protein KUF83_17650 [Streptomyces sp. BV286]|uniref:hypothetical protein n=1 Tax=unclassified Streptomyces TaxID=2593676 RepID=UPI001C2E02D3|nr:hypothetical protein [Streptomyces sp. BV286]MBV1938374.1 hypothetical protein [Streptomyces sp. BV286]
MAGSAKPRRRRAAAPSLRYEHRPGKRSRSNEQGSGKGEKAFGCLLFLSFTALVVLLAVADMFWGDETWEWSADTWPGGAYSFAAFLGALVPCVATLFVMSASRTKWKSWKSHKARSFGFTLLAVMCGAAMLQLVSLIYNAQNTGKWGRGRDRSPSWVFSNYPWLWAVGLSSTIVMAALLITWAVARHKRKSATTDAADADAHGGTGAAISTLEPN